MVFYDRRCARSSTTSAGVAGSPIRPRRPCCRPRRPRRPPPSGATGFCKRVAYLDASWASESMAGAAVD